MRWNVMCKIVLEFKRCTFQHDTRLDVNAFDTHFVDSIHELGRIRYTQSMPQLGFGWLFKG